MVIGGLKNGDQVRGLTHQELLKIFNDSREITGFADETSAGLDSLSGNSFNFLKDRDGNPVGPLIGYRRALNPHEWSKSDLFMRHAVRESLAQNTLATGDPLTAGLFNYLTQSPAFNQARNIIELADDQQRSFIPGFRNAAPQTTLGAAVNAITYRARRDVDSFVMLGASQIQDLKSRYTQAEAKRIFEGAMGDNISLINSPRNAKSLMLLNQTWSHGRGWNFVPKPAEIPLPDGTKGFALVLDHTNRENQTRFLEAFGRELTQNQPLLNPQGKTAVMDELAFDTHIRFQNVTSTVLNAKNTLLRAQGLPEISSRSHYIPPPELKGKYVAWTFDSGNNVVNDLTVIADSPEQFASMKIEAQNSPLWRSGYRIRSKDDIGEFMSLWDKAQMDWHDPLTTALQPGKVNKGRLSGPTIDHQAFAQGLVRMRDQIFQHGDDMIETLFDQPLKSAAIRGQLAKLETVQGNLPSARHSSIYDRYAQNLLGQSALATKDSFFGDASRWLESRVNGLLASPPAQIPGKIGQVLADWTRAAVPGKSTRGQQFDDFAKALGPYLPYKSVTELSAAKAGSQTPADIKAISAKLSWFEASHRLRWLESMQGAVNLASMVTNMPSVLRALQPRVGESIEEAAARNSSLTMVAKIRGEDVIVPNIPKLVWASMLDSFHWNKTAMSPLREEATRIAYGLGHMNQEVAEMNRSYGAIDNKADWRGWVFGDKQREGTNLRDKIARKGGLDKALGILSDKSEDISRQWGMHAGFRIGEAMGLEDPHDLVAFGRELTDKMIANYDPRNRPEVFQGALGSLVGLFQSYMANFYTRMFRYVETQDRGALLSQLAMQSAVFGVDSLPGWDAMNWAYFDRGHSKGEDPVDSMYKRLGTPTADLLMHGTLSNLPKIFGQDGVALYTRGDISARLPGSEWTLVGGKVPVPNLPIVDTLTRLGKGIYAGIGAASTGVHVGPSQWAEIASNTVVNRPLAGIIETLGTGGLDTAWDGQVASRTQTTADSVYRWLGVKSEIQQKSVDSFYADKTAQEEQQARRDVLNTQTRAAIRANKLDAVPQLFSQYVQNGGDPRRYSAWVKDSVKYALQTRSEIKLAQALKDPTNRSNATIARLLDGEVGVQEGELATEDYGRAETVDQLLREGWEATPQPVDTLDANDPFRGTPAPGQVPPGQ